jgi:4-hydroxyphenylacetate 3-monooxygenase
MFYSGAPLVTRGNSFRFYDWDGPKRAVEQFMNSYGLPADGMNISDAAE